MSRKERERLTVMLGVKKQKLKLVQAAELMAVGYRQSKRIWKRYQADGDAGLVHRLRGQPSARRKSPANSSCKNPLRPYLPAAFYGNTEAFRRLAAKTGTRGANL